MTTDKKGTILVIEDDPIQLEYAREVCVSEDYDFQFVSSMEEVEIPNYGGQNPVGVLSDIHIPNYAGSNPYPWGITITFICRRFGIPSVLVTSGGHGEEATEWMTPIFGIEKIKVWEGTENGRKKWFDGLKELMGLVKSL